VASQRWRLPTKTWAQVPKEANYELMSHYPPSKSATHGGYSWRILQNLGQKAAAFKRGMNAQAHASDTFPPYVDVIARLLQKRGTGTLYLTNQIVFAGSALHRSRGYVTQCS